MSDINWGLAVNRTNPFAEFTQGMEQGRQRRMDEDRANLFVQQQKRQAEKDEREMRADRENRMARGILGHVAKTDPRAAATKAVEVGQYELAEQFSKLDESQRKIARDNAEDLGGFAATIKQLPYEQRKAIIAQARPTLLQYGLKPEDVDGFDPTDEKLQGLMASSMSLTQALAQANQERDDKRAEEKAKADEAYRAKMLAQGDRRIGLSADANRRGWASFNERKKAGGFGTPGVSGGVIADEDVEIDP